MKKTVNINLGGIGFTIDEDAYLVLQNYLDDIASRLPESDAEIINDIESRLAEIFQTSLSLRYQVIDLSLVGRAMTTMGRPEEFGEKKRIEEIRETRREEPRKLYRNMNDKMIGGVCSRIAAYLKIDPTWVRIVTLLLIVFTGVPLMAYIILWIVVPKA